MAEIYRYGAKIDCNTRYKFYGNEVRISVFSRDIFKTEVSTRKRIIKRGAAKEEERRADNIARTKDKVFDIAYANQWDYFVTLTLDRKKIDRYNYDDIKKAYKIWINNLVQRHGVRYLTVAELHKPLLIDGKVMRAVHFHSLISSLPTRFLKDSGHADEEGHRIYNLTNWKFGFTTAIETYGSHEATAKYITKYITKELAGIYGKQYWSGGKDLIREVPTTYGHEDYTTATGQEFKIEIAQLGIKYRREDL